LSIFGISHLPFNFPQLKAHDNSDFTGSRGPKTRTVTRIAHDDRIGCNGVWVDHEDHHQPIAAVAHTYSQRQDALSLLQEFVGLENFEVAGRA
jgi:hypothetical protein